MRKGNKKNSNKGKIYSLVLLFIVGSFAIIINDSGLIKLIKIKRKYSKIQKDISSLQSQQIKLNNEIHELKTNTSLIEKIAREKFMMAKPGEKVFKVVEYKTVE